MRTEAWKEKRREVLKTARTHFKALRTEILQGLVAFLVLLGWPFYHGFRYIKGKHDTNK